MENLDDVTTSENMLTWPRKCKHTYILKIFSKSVISLVYIPLKDLSTSEVLHKNVQITKTGNNPHAQVQKHKVT